MLLLSQIASPFVWLLSKSTSFIVNLIGLKKYSGKVTEEEIKSMIQEGTDDGEIQEMEQDIVERVFLLGDLKVGSIMTHRSEIVSLDINMSASKIREILEQNLFEIYPVIENSFDNVKGIISLKDIIFKIDQEGFDLQKTLTPATFFHENLSVYKALEKMKNQCFNQALIIDEFGCCQGIITLKDILEE